ncbi:MAG TPA: wax ester/triacylglycerol synthase domain-containing protein, partial [Acidimicrobiales bacterium]|nr:wax ester/triacylglycerol synthase domain-containing protein [Acidimicrobiales bacterium]
VDPNFDLDFHLRWVSGGSGHTMRDVLDYAQPIAMQSFDRARPQWEIHVVEGLDDGGAAMIVKIHHAITDGVGAVAMAMILFELAREPAHETPLPPEPEPDVMGPFERLVDGIRHEIDREREAGHLVAGGVSAAVTALLRDPGTALRQGGAVAASAGRLIAPATRPKSAVMTERSLKMHFDTLRVPLDLAKAAARMAGGRLNDAFVAATTAGLRRYHEAHGASTGTLRMAMPINVRHDDDGAAGGNHFVPARFDVPLVIDDPVERMRSVHELVAEQRAEPALDLVDPMAGVLNRLPRSVTTEVFGSVLRGVDVVTSNVPGAPIELFSAGAKVTDMFAFAPLAGAAINITLLSYVDRCYVAVNSDRAAVVDPERLIDCLRQGWDEILAVADDSPIAIAT